MKKRFIVLLAFESDDQSENFQKFIKENGLAWWHWIKNSWLLIDPHNRFTAESLYREVEKMYPGVRKLVMEFEQGSGSWWGYGPTGDKGMFPWLRDEWTD